MHGVSRTTVIRGCCLLAAMLLSVPAFAQPSFATTYQTTDFSGEWTEIPHEGSFQYDLGDYSGIPFNAAGRMRADSHDHTEWNLPEIQCRPHPGIFNWFYGGGVRIMKEIDPVSRQLTALHVQFLRSLDRPIYMDGRPHPPEWAPHTWAGFSTGRFDGNMLVITTTHLKESYIRANGTMFSEKAKVTEYLVLDGDLLTVTTLLDDSVYLEEPLIQSVSYRRNLHQELPYFPCTVSVENTFEGVPHFFPWKNPNLTETAERRGLPLEGVRGGAETIYPEYRQKQRSVPRPSPARTSAQQRDGELQVVPIRGNAFMILGAGGNITLSAGVDGLLLVDTGSAAMADKLLEKINEIGTMVAASPARMTTCVGPLCYAPGSSGPLSHYGFVSPSYNAVIGSPAPLKPLRWIIQTSIDPDHTGATAKLSTTLGKSFSGGNVTTVLGDAAAGEGSTIIAQENVLRRMTELKFPETGWPLETYYFPTYKMSQFVNGEGIQMYHAPAAITDGDTVVYFRYSDVISAGDVYTPDRYPMIDIAKGGTVQGVIDALNKIMDITIPEFRHQGGTMIVPGHGRLADQADVAAYRNMVSIVRDRIQELMKEGKSLQQIKAARPTLDYDGVYGSPDTFIEAVYQNLTAKRTGSR